LYGSISPGQDEDGDEGRPQSDPAGHELQEAESDDGGRGERGAAGGRRRDPIEQPGGEDGSGHSPARSRAPERERQRRREPDEKVGAQIVPVDEHLQAFRQPEQGDAQVESGAGDQGPQKSKPPGRGLDRREPREADEEEREERVLVPLRPACRLPARSQPDREEHQT
jgi:hypothetical protein